MPFCMVLVTWVPIRNAPENSSTAANPESSVRYASAFILFVPWKTTDCIASGTVSAANAITTEIDIAIRGDIWNALAISDSSDSPFCSSSDSVASACPLEPLSALAKEDIVARGRPRVVPQAMNPRWQLSNRVTEQESGSRSSPSCSSMCSGNGEERGRLRHGVAEAKYRFEQRSTEKKKMRLRGRRGGRWTGGSRLAVAIGALLAKDHRTENQLVCSRPDAEEKNNQRLCPCIRH
uniref:Uncharacterized protein n=1 Tax=Oryza nivara TaxID=4536 RepID=A0A0E0G972_ORYNI